MTDASGARRWLRYPGISRLAARRDRGGVVGGGAACGAPRGGDPGDLHQEAGK